MWAASCAACDAFARQANETFSSDGASSWARPMLPEITVKMLFRSRAIPPTRVPSDSILPLVSRSSSRALAFGHTSRKMPKPRHRLDGRELQTIWSCRLARTPQTPPAFGSPSPDDNSPRRRVRSSGNFCQSSPQKFFTGSTNNLSACGFTCKPPGRDQAKNPSVVFSRMSVNVRADCWSATRAWLRSVKSRI